MRKKNRKDPASRRRRRGVLNGLENQLKKGTKPLQVKDKESHLALESEIPLTDKDKERIGREIGVLKTRL